MKVSYEEAVRLGWMDAAAVPKKATTPGKRKDAEGEEQVLLLDWFRSTYPLEAELLIHIPNGGSRKNAFEGWRLKQQGVRAGVSDLFLPHARGGFFGFWLEFKATPPFDSKVSKSQEDWLLLMDAQNYATRLGKGLDAAKREFQWYMSLPLTVVQR